MSGLNVSLPRIVAAALESLGDWIRSNGRRLLLLIDGTNLLLSNLAGTAEPGAPKAAKGRTSGQGTKAAKVDGGATPLWRLRSRLSLDPGIFWLGASYQTLETEHAYQDASWDFFELHEIRPCRSPRCARPCWSSPVASVPVVE
jgi:hypothetical protein